MTPMLGGVFHLVSTLASSAVADALTPALLGGARL